jgi:hypothetical protein
MKLLSKRWRHTKKNQKKHQKRLTTIKKRAIMKKKVIKRSKLNGGLF